jgi:sulfur-carrier protein
MSNKYSESLIKTCTRATICIPYHLREITNDQKQITLLINELQPTVRLVLGNLLTHYPSLASAIFDENGEIGKFLSVYLNDQNIKQLKYLDTILKEDNNELIIRPALAGG